MWPDSRIQTLLGIELPIIQAPMAGSVTSEMVIAVANAGGLGSLPCATISAEKIRDEVRIIREHTKRPINLNFFCHKTPEPNPDRDAAWMQRLAPYYDEFGLKHEPAAGPSRAPFDSAMCDLVAELKPEIVSFHFGLPDDHLLKHTRNAGAKILSSATTVEEAIWLEARGCDAIIAQGNEAGGHRGMFLSADISTQIGTMALVPQVVDAVKIPVIAAGGIADARAIVAAFALGASAVQLGTAYLFCPEAKIHPIYLQTLKSPAADYTALTNIFSGRPARAIVNRLMREVGPMSDLAPKFPQAGAAVAPLKAKSEAASSPDFMQMWSGQAARYGREMPAGELTRRLAGEAMNMWKNSRSR